MPSAKETTFFIQSSDKDSEYFIGVMPDTTQDFLSRDVDLLVSQIKENLRLSGLKAKSSVSQKTRPSPYRVPSRSWADPANYEFSLRTNESRLRRKKLRSTQTHDGAEDDPYELLQELLRGGGLIKEAVKRLQENLEDFEDSTEDDDDEDNEDERPLQRRGQLEDTSIYRRKPYFYDEEDEPLPPIYQPLDL